MLVFHLAHYKIIMDPAYAVEFLNEIWAKEPVGALSVCIALTGIVITLGLKILDYLWDIQKEQARQGRLKIELMPAAPGKTGLTAVICNTGREPIVLRDIGYARPRLLGREFVPVELPNDPLPHALNARDLIRITLPADATLPLLADSFQVRDSLGKIWDAPDAELRKARKYSGRSGKAKKARTNRAEVPPTPPEVEVL